METLIVEIETIIKKELPNFWFSVKERKSFDGIPYLGIQIAASGYNICNVQGQRPQAVSLKLVPSTWLLDTQVFGGCGGGAICRKPNRENPNEKYLAMKSEKISFRRPGPTKEGVMKAIQKFCVNYKKTLIEFKDVLNYSEYCDYDTLLK